jgi:hypothetical protein
MDFRSYQTEGFYDELFAADSAPVKPGRLPRPTARDFMRWTTSSTGGSARSPASNSPGR